MCTVCTLGYNDFYSLVLPGRCSCLQHLILRTFIKKKFSGFLALAFPFAFKVCKMCGMIKKSFFEHAYAYKDAQFDTDFESAEKRCKTRKQKSYQRKSERKIEFLTFITVCKIFRSLTFWR